MHNRPLTLSFFALTFLLSGCSEAAVNNDTSNLCYGMVVDQNSRSMQSLERPGYLKTVLDPAFGSTIRRISQAEAGQVIKPIYSTIQAWNSDESYLLIWEQGNGYQLLDGENYRLIRYIDDIYPGDIEEVFWDFKHPNILYYIEPLPRGGSEPGRRLIRYDVDVQKKQVVRSFQGLCETNHPLVSGGDVQMMSWDSDKIGLRCGKNPAKFFTYTISTDTLSRITQSGKKTGLKPWFAPQPGPSGKYFYQQGNVYDTNYNYVLTLDLNVTHEHASLGKLPNGNDGYFAASFDGNSKGKDVGSLVVHDMETGDYEVIVGPKTGYPYPPTGTHISAVAHKNPNWVALSSIGDVSGENTLDQEIYLANVSKSNRTICRVAHHRSYGKKGKVGYFSEPHVTISPSGTRILFGSDWGNSGRVDTYVVELPAFKQRKLARK